MAVIMYCYFIFPFQTTTALEFVQNDLSEFVNTIQHDTSVVIADSATAVNRSIKVRDITIRCRNYSLMLLSVSS